MSSGDTYLNYIRVEAIVAWLDSRTKLPEDKDYNRGYNDAILDVRIAVKNNLQSDHERPAGNINK